jgi:tryptophan synthase beta chain
VDLAAYAAYLEGKLQDYELPTEEIERALQDISSLPKPAI